MTTTTPQDRKKAKKKDKAPAGPYEFTATVIGDGGVPEERVFVLPSAEEAASKISGRFLRDAAMNGDEGEMALGFATLEAAGAEPAAIDALYDMPAPETLKHLFQWMQHKVAPESASVGESSGSSA